MRALLIIGISFLYGYERRLLDILTIQIFAICGFGYDIPESSIFSGTPTDLAIIRFILRAYVGMRLSTDRWWIYKVASRKR